METSIKYIYLHKTAKSMSCHAIYYACHWEKYIAHGPLIALSLPEITWLTITAQPWQNLEGYQGLTLLWKAHKTSTQLTTVSFLQSECSFFFVVIFDITAVAPAPTVLAVPVTTAPAVPTTPELTLYVVPATHLTPDTPAPTVLDPDCKIQSKAGLIYYCITTLKNHITGIKDNIRNMV